VKKVVLSHLYTVIALYFIVGTFVCKEAQIHIAVLMSEYNANSAFFFFNSIGVSSTRKTVLTKILFLAVLWPLSVDANQKLQCKAIL
jgi:hypothetical protein